MCLLSMTEMSAYELTNRPWTEGVNSLGRFTRMNSIAHFIRYAKELRATEGKAAKPQATQTAGIQLVTTRTFKATWSP